MDDPLQNDEGRPRVTQKIPTVAELATVRELAKEQGIGESTAWQVVKRHNLSRYRLPGKGKRTYVRRADFERARQTPILVSDTKEVAA